MTALHRAKTNHGVQAKKDPARATSSRGKKVAARARKPIAKVKKARPREEATNGKRPPSPVWDWRPIGDFLKESRIPGATGATARKLSVKLYAKGVGANKGRRVGSANTRYYVRRAGQFIYSKLDFLNGAFGIVPKELDGYESTLDLPTFDFRPGIEPMWLLNYIARPEFYKAQAQKARGGRKARRIAPEDFLRMRIPVPPDGERTRVLGMLSSLNKMDAEAQAACIAVENLEFVVLSRAFTRGLRKQPLVAVNGWKIGRPAHCTLVPKAWKLVRLTEVARLESGHTPSRTRKDYWNGRTPWLSLQDVWRFDETPIRETTERISQLGLKNSSARLLPPHTVAFCRTAGSAGNCTVLGVSMTTSQDFANFVCGPQVAPKFLKHLFLWMQPVWRSLASGSTHTTIYMPIFQQLQLLLPPLEEQNEIVKMAEVFTRVVSILRAEIRALATTRDALVGQLFRGKKTR